MPTTVEIDARIEELERQKAQLKEQRRAAAAREREQARKWKSATFATVGEIVQKAIGTDWTGIDLSGLASFLNDNREALSVYATASERTPQEAKEALDAFRKAEREAKRQEAEPVENVERDGQQEQQGDMW